MDAICERRAELLKKKKIISTFSEQEKFRVSELETALDESECQYQQAIEEFRQLKIDSQNEIDSLAHQNKAIVDRLQSEKQQAAQEAAELTVKLQQLNER